MFFMFARYEVDRETLRRQIWLYAAAATFAIIAIFAGMYGSPGENQRKLIFLFFAGGGRYVDRFARIALRRAAVWTGMTATACVPPGFIVQLCVLATECAAFGFTWSTLLMYTEGARRLFAGIAFAGAAVLMVAAGMQAAVYGARAFWVQLKGRRFLHDRWLRRKLAEDMSAALALSLIEASLQAAISISF